MNSSAIEEGGGGGLTQRKKQETNFDVVDRVEKLDEPKQYVGYGEVLDTGCSGWVCRILGSYCGYAFRLWELTRCFPKHQKVYI